VSLADWRDEAFIRAQLTPESFAVVDSYLAEPQVYEWISANCRRAVYIDDNQRITYPAGVVVNPSLYGHRLDYPQRPGVAYLLGPQYVILRPEFQQLPPRIRRTEVQRVLVTLGGADVLNLTPRILRVLNEHFPRLEKHVVIGPGFTNLTEIEAQVDDRVVLHHQPDAAQMRDLMLFCDIAVTAAGQTVHELLATGVPFLAIEVVENQQLNMRGLETMGLEEFLVREGEIAATRLVSFVGGTYSRFPSLKTIDHRGAARSVASLLENL
jgi:spore coat polysaccharide biosynthesis predicted glycosyltransferase SpsG